MSEPRNDGGRTAVAVVCSLAVLGTGIAAVVYNVGNSGKHGATPVAYGSFTVPAGTFDPSNPLPTSSGAPLPTGDQPTSTTNSPAPDDSSTGGNPLDTTAAAGFNWDSLNENSTDPTPFTEDALLPQTFVDDQGINYTIDSGGQQSCVQSTMSQDIKDVLQQYGCQKAMTGSYLVDSTKNKVDSSNDILVSVQIWPFPDAATATKVEDALSAASQKQFSIWCPTSGPGAAPCNSQNYYSAATYWALQAHYRYVIEATAVYTNMTQDKSVAYAWEKTAVSEAAKDCGPQVYASSQ